MFWGKYPALLARKEREIELLTAHLEDIKLELTTARKQLDRVYCSILKLDSSEFHKLSSDREIADGVGR